MMTQEQNDELTQVGPGTPMGDVLRHYWYPVAFVRELAAECEEFGLAPMDFLHTLADVQTSEPASVVFDRIRQRLGHAVERQRTSPDLPYGLDLWRDGARVLGVLWSDDGASEVVAFARGPWEDEALALAL